MRRTLPSGTSPIRSLALLATKDFNAMLHDSKDTPKFQTITDEGNCVPQQNPGLIRNRNKIFSVRKNARIVQDIQNNYFRTDHEPANNVEACNEIGIN